MFAWFKKKEDPNDEFVYIKYGYGFEYRKVEYDADGRPFVLIHGDLVRLDTEKPTREFVWVKRRKL